MLLREPHKLAFRCFVCMNALSNKAFMSNTEHRLFGFFSFLTVMV